MIKILVAEVATRLNFFPSKGGIQVSPRIMLKHPKLEYAKHCIIPFGSYVQARHEANPYNTAAPRTLDCIYLRPTYSPHGGHELLAQVYDLQDNQLPITANQNDDTY